MLCALPEYFKTTEQDKFMVVKVTMLKRKKPFLYEFIYGLKKNSKAKTKEN